jgi:hypothetical protein
MELDWFRNGWKVYRLDLIERSCHPVSLTFKHRYTAQDKVLGVVLARLVYVQQIHVRVDLPGVSIVARDRATKEPGGVFAPRGSFAETLLVCSAVYTA